MLRTSVFAMLAALTVAAPVIGADTAKAQSQAPANCWHDGNPKHFQAECPNPPKLPEPTKKVVKSAEPEDRSRERAEFNGEELFDRMMQDSGGSGGGGGR